MSALSIGLSTFNSCNKAGSIPHFTQHLSHYPNDYQALIWRGRAYSIIGKPVQAKADFEKAIRVSSGSQKLLAQAHIENIAGNIAQKVVILQNTTRQYPNCSEAWFDLGSHTYQVDKKVDISLQHLRRADNLATINSETGEPWYPWCSQTIGDIYFYEKQQVNEARKRYEAAIRSCNTLTIGHLGLSRCCILENNLERSNTSFLTAKRLNPVLVKWETFEDFHQHVLARNAIASLSSEFSKLFSDLFSATPQSQTASDEGTSDTVVRSSRSATGANPPDSNWSLSREFEGNVKPGSHQASKHSTSAALQSSKSVLEIEHPYRNRQRFSREVETNAPNFNHPSPQFSASATPITQGRRTASGYQAAGKSGRSSGPEGRGNGGSGNGGGSDDEDMSPVQKAAKRWKKIKKEAPNGKRYYGLYFYQSPCKEFWYSKIDASERHGGAYFKLYKDRGRTIELIASLDENLKRMTNKHESGKFAVIEKSKMQGI